jgi:hypothetical protein
LPFSFAMDSILLPKSIYAEIFHWIYQPRWIAKQKYNINKSNLQSWPWLISNAKVVNRPKLGIGGYQQQPFKRAIADGQPSKLDLVDTPGKQMKQSLGST